MYTSTVSIVVIGALQLHLEIVFYTRDYKDVGLTFYFLGRVSKQMKSLMFITFRLLGICLLSMKIIIYILLIDKENLQRFERKACTRM